MDHYGIGAAMRCMSNVYFQSARQTGRTTSLVDSVKNGDRVIFSCSREADRVKRLCLERGITIDCLVVRVDQPNRIFERAPSEGRTIFDHSWVEAYYAETINRAVEAIDHFERESSGFGEAHRATRRQAEEIARFGR